MTLSNAEAVPANLKPSRCWYVAGFTPAGPVKTFYRSPYHPLHVDSLNAVTHELARAASLASKKILVNHTQVTIISVIELDKETEQSHFRGSPE